MREAQESDFYYLNACNGKGEVVELLLSKDELDEGKKRAENMAGNLKAKALDTYVCMTPVTGVKS